MDSYILIVSLVFKGWAISPAPVMGALVFKDGASSAQKLHNRIISKVIWGDDVIFKLPVTSSPPSG